MTKREVKNILNIAKKRFFEKDTHLLSIEANERSITHKYAECLQSILGCAWQVDCEYNRYGTDPKIIEEIEQIVGKETTTSEIKTRTVYPDIIIHKRGINGPNLVVIEAKKDATDNERQKDKNKLKKIKQQYIYDFAIFLNFKTGDKCDIEIELIK